MKFRKNIMGFTLVLAMLLTTGCGFSRAGEERGAEQETGSSSEEVLRVNVENGQSSRKETEAEESTSGAPDETWTATFETIAGLLRKSDLQASEVFGGGKENWTEDKAFYIGRIYQVNLFDEEVLVYTSYDEKQLVNSISIWLTNGENTVMEEDALQWVERLNAFTGTEPDFYEAASEGGSKRWKWFLGDRAFALNWLDDMLTISMNVVVGELD